MGMTQPRIADGSGPELNLPRSGHESRMAQIPEGEPSTVAVDIIDGSESKAEPSTLSLNIADGSMSMG